MKDNLLKKEDVIKAANRLEKQVSTYSPETGKTVQRALQEVAKMGCGTTKEDKEIMINAARVVVAGEVSIAEKHVETLKEFEGLLDKAAQLWCGGP